MPIRKFADRYSLLMQNYMVLMSSAKTHHFLPHWEEEGRHFVHFSIGSPNKSATGVLQFAFILLMGTVLSQRLLQNPQYFG
jgi:hypothetical protein